MQAPQTSELPALIDNLKAELTRLPTADAESLLKTASDVQACVDLARQQATAADGLTAEQAEEIFNILEQFSDMLSRAQARTARALLSLGVGEGLYQDPSGQQAVTPGTGRTLGRSHLTA